jgi:cation diffusion facilitator family transporter
MDRLYKKALLLEYFTVGYNLLEAFVSILFGSLANSIALIAFGLDSIVESLSGLVLVWRLLKHGKISPEQEERIEKRAQRFVAITFFILGAYVSYESIGKLVRQESPEASLPGIVIAIVSIIVMPILMIQKYRTGQSIGSKALIADSKETLACSLLSVALLIGLCTNYFLGFWQADPIVGLIIVIFLIREGIESWQEAKE